MECQTKNKDKPSRLPWPERKGNVKKNVQKALDAGDIEALIEALPPLQKQFAEEYIIDWNGAEAVRRTDSTTEYPNRLAYLWLSNAGVRAYISHLTAERTAQMKIDQGYVVQKLIRTLEKAEEQQNHAIVLRAAELVARHLGMFVEKQEITGKDGEAIKVVNEDAAAFTSAISKLVKRGREDEMAGESDS